MKSVAIIVPPKRLDMPTLESCVEIWRKELRVSMFRVGTQLEELTPGNLTAHGLDELHDESFDAIAVLSGAGTREFLWDHAQVIAHLQNFERARKLVAAFGSGCVVLAQAGVLVGKEATVSNSAELIDQLVSYGAIYVPADVVVTKWIITGTGNNAQAFAHAVASGLRNSGQLFSQGSAGPQISE